MGGEMPDRAIAPLLEESLDDLYEHAPCGYLSALPDGLIVKVNQTFLEWTGYQRDDLVGRRRFQDLLTAGGRIYHETHYAPLLRMQGSVREIALQIVRADGSRLPALVNSVLRSAPAGTVVRTTVFDASDRRAYERELLEARRRETEARQRTERLQRLAEALVAAPGQSAVAAAALEATVEALGARGGTVSRDGTIAVSGAEGPVTEGIDLPGADGPVGRMLLHFDAPPEITEPDREFLLAAARQCGQALERATLAAETQRAARRSGFLAQMGEALEGTPELGERARRLVDLIAAQLAGGARVELAGDLGRPALVAEAGVVGAPAGIPLNARGRRLGTLFIDEANRTDDADPGFLSELAARAAVALENAQLYEHERRVAGALQESMLTRRLPRDPRFRVATHYQPALETMEVGGDWYDAFLLGDGRLAIAVGDVVGRGIAAASAMGQLRSALRALAGACPGPSEVVERLDHFVEQVDLALASTLVYADVSLDTGVIRYACAGHPPPIVMPLGSDAAPVWDGRSPPLGHYPGFEARPHAEVHVEPGTRAILYTDGLVEHRGQLIDVGIDALAAALAAERATPLDELVERIPAALIDRREARDDVCLLALEITAA